MRRFKNGGAVCCVSCQRMYVSCRTHQGRTSKTHGGVKAHLFHNHVHQLEPGLRFFDDTIHTYLHPMGRRALHERPWEYHQMVDTTHGDLSSLRSAMGVGVVCKISQKGYKAAETTNYVCHPCAHKRISCEDMDNR